MVDVRSWKKRERENGVGEKHVGKVVTTWNEGKDLNRFGWLLYMLGCN